VRPGVLLTAILLAACDAGAPPDPRVVPTPLDPARTGRIRGVVAFDGTPPPKRRLPVGGNPECAALHPDGALDEAVLVRDGRLMNVLVFLRSGLGGRVFAWPKEPVRIANARCMYVPRVAAAMTHQPVEFVNEDPADHNVHGFSEQGAFNFTLLGKGSSRTIKVRRPEAPFRVKCDLHPWMLGWLAVFDHPYFRVTGPDGAFELDGVPAGDYEIDAWHETLGTRNAKVAVSAGGTADLEFRFTP
jgi:plastocyanin